MSLDFYLYEFTDYGERIDRCALCGVATVVAAHRAKSHVFDRNITHNLGAMAGAAGLYEALWHPKISDVRKPSVSAVRDVWSRLRHIDEYDAAHRVEEAMPDPKASDLVDTIRDGLKWLLENEPAARKFDAPNGWGLYQHFVSFVEDVLRACEQHPDALVEVSR